MVKAKRSERVNYWIDYRLPNGKQKREIIGKKLSDAQAAEGKRKAQKKENPKVLEITADNKTTFSDLVSWYTDLQKVKRLKTFGRVKICLNNFNKIFSDTFISELSVAELEDYVEKRKDDGLKNSSISLELSIVKQMVKKAFYSDKISGGALKAFERLDTVFRRGSNARTRILSITEYLTLIDAADDFLKPIIEFAINTGMRTESEILSLKWSQVDLKTGFIRLAAEDTKECKAKNIPINHNVARILDNTVRHINHDYVFTFRNKPIRKLTHFITCCNQAGLTYGYKSENEIVARDIRRTVKTYMVEAGVNEIYRDIILGHSKRGMDIHYIHPDEETLKTAIQKYTKWLDDKIETARSQFVDQAVDQK